MTTKRLRTRVLLVVALLVPSLALASAPEVAQAATVVGTSAGWTVDMSNRFLGGVNCTGSARWVVQDGSPRIEVAGKCSYVGAANTVGGFHDGSTILLTFKGVQSDGECEHAGQFNLTPGGGVTTTSYSGNVSGSLMNLAYTGGARCSITSVCTYVHAENTGPFSENYGPKCVSVNLGAPPEPNAGQGSCTRYTDATPPKVTTSVASNLATVVFEAHYNRTASGQVAGDLQRVDYVYVAFRVRSTGATAFAQLGEFLPRDGIGPATMNHTKAQWYWNDTRGYDVLGVGFMPPDLQTGSWQALPQNQSTGMLGVTDPAKCAFYWGTKIATVANSDIDEPLGGIDTGTTGGLTPTDPETTDPTNGGGCGFSFTDPGTWAAGGMCAAVGLLGELVRAIQALVQVVTGLVVALSDLFVFLFVPHPSSWDWDGFIDQANSRPPMSVALQSGEIAGGIASGYQSAGDCGVLISLEGHDLECSAIRNVAGFSTLYALVQVGMVSLTLLGIYNLLSESLRKG